MKDFKRKSWWHELRDVLKGWMDDGDPIVDPTVAFHLAFTFPLLIAVAAMLHRG